MAFYLNSSYPQEQIVALEERCKNEGRTVPAMGMLFEIGSVESPLSCIAFYNAWGGSLVAGQTLDDLTDLNTALGFDMEARCYVIHNSLLDDFKQGQL